MRTYGDSGSSAAVSTTTRAVPSGCSAVFEDVKFSVIFFGISSTGFLFLMSRSGFNFESWIEFWWLFPVACLLDFFFCKLLKAAKALKADFPISLRIMPLQFGILTGRLGSSIESAPFGGRHLEEPELWLFFCPAGNNIMRAWQGYVYPKFIQLELRKKFRASKLQSCTFSFRIRRTFRELCLLSKRRRRIPRTRLP